jgi:hypothetical protein
MPSSINRYHADWLSLIEISGPFISLPVLTEVFPQGLQDVPVELARSLRADFEFWQESANDPAVHSAWIRLVLEAVLGYSDEVLLRGQAIPAGLKGEFPEHEENLRPDLILAEPSSGGERTPRLLIQVFPLTQSLDKAVTGSRWAASVGTRMMELLHATEIRLGLVTNGEQWMLVDAPRGETTGFITWYASLWLDERATLNAFQSLLGVRRFFGVAKEETLENLLARSADHQQEITDQLGLQVRHAVEILIQSLDKADQERGRKLLGEDISPDLLYEAALTVMMRLVFMLAAEERKLLPIDDEQYSNYYAVSTLREQLNQQATLGEEVLEYRYDAWSRLLAVFRAVYGGIHHQDLHLPAYGGSLFNPDKYPFLEGRVARTKWQEAPARPLPIDNRTVLHLLDALQMLQVSGEMRRLSFRALDVEQIGHVYEGLLDHRAARASEVMLGLGGAKRLEPEIALSILEQARAKGEASLLELLKDETQKSPSALKNALADVTQKDAQKLSRMRSACGSDDALLARVLPFASLIRMDDFGNPAVILPGSVYVTAGTTRRATGTHYTPRSLTEPIVQHTLEPLVYAGVTEGLPREQWRLRSPAELLDLKVCDMAMGSAGFLVQVVRYLAERLLEAWSAESGQWMVDGDDGLWSMVNGLSSDEDRLMVARRLVAERCVYGVDKNPLAVEIAKLSLWLVTLAKEKPFTFLDHALKCGDSLVGTSADDFLRWANRRKTPVMSLDQEVLREELETARGLRKQLESFVALDVRDAERKQSLLLEADAAMEHVKRGADLLAGAKLLGLSTPEVEDLQVQMVDPFLAGDLDDSIDPAKYPDTARALNASKKERVFHWEFEFPEVFQYGGFSAFVGNPPFVGGTKLRAAVGNLYRLAVLSTYAGSNGNSDLCAFFFRRCFQNLKKSGTFGLLAINTIAQGDTRQTGLDNILKSEAVIYRANTDILWPGSASVAVHIVYISKEKFSPPYYLNDNMVSHISNHLDSQLYAGQPHILIENQHLSFLGTYPNGTGFILSEEEANNLIERNPKNSNVLFPYLIGEDLNSSPECKPSRWIINFQDWSIEEAKQYPDCFKIVKDRVYPERSKNNNKQRREIWWRFTRPTLDLYAALQPLRKVMVCSLVTKYLNFALVEKGWVYSKQLGVFAIDDYARYAVLQSSVHEAWGRKYSSTLEMRLSYALSDSFETFPFSQDLKSLEKIGETYDKQRRSVMMARQEGLTATYNRFHNPEESAKDIVRLRELHVELDKAVASAYGWEDLELGHDFHETAQGVRFTVSEFARREILSRLLKLNHERYEEEVRAGLHEKGAKKEVKKKEGGKGTKPARKGKSAEGQMELL